MSCGCNPCNCCCCASNLIEVRVFGFNESGFTYVISRGGEQLERAVSFSAIGFNFIPNFPFIDVRTISGSVRRDGSIISGTGDFTVEHVPGTGTYNVIFTRKFSIVMPNEEPNVQVIPDAGFSAPGAGEAAAYITGRISAEGNVESGTKLPDGRFAFTVEKNPNLPGYYTVRFRPELQVTLLIPAGLQVQVFDFLRGPACSCCACCCAGDEPISQGAASFDVTAEGFSYRTFVETFTGRIYTDLPVTFAAIVNVRQNVPQANALRASEITAELMKLGQGAWSLTENTLKSILKKG
ncbi:hypothetical protein LRR81_12875 [Metabacillus sp. GX 13764]|uniref:hypothetical protein n=1 Tax=Metabacillus kandeliae TaxID=2900151 RepID=UPI001E522A5E|nr:hypothetical protein [Metabacillus kandeliae]MCD7035133.1 hypothetical protein [Metabacillus kandeliae]